MFFFEGVAKFAIYLSSTLTNGLENKKKEEKTGRCLT